MFYLLRHLLSVVLLPGTMVVLVPLWIARRYSIEPSWPRTAGGIVVAICGALLGAAQGRDAVPLQWRNAVLTCRPVRAKDVRHPRPKTYWPDDALELAEALVSAGQVRSDCN
jgi:hypothetical protein